jgi:16S rRNA (guanine966-N2)-methyltransferase
MRIVGGRYGGRLLFVPEGRTVRPTADRARESIFNILEHNHLRLDRGPNIRDMRVLDGFAGTGAYGLEALSRGAVHAVFMDRDLSTCRKNLFSLALEKSATLIVTDCLKPPRASRACDLLFLDPPYRDGVAAQAIAALAGASWIADGALIVVELGLHAPFRPPARCEALDERRYGAARMVVLRFGGEPQAPAVER